MPGDAAPPPRSTVGPPGPAHAKPVAALLAGALGALLVGLTVAVVVVDGPLPGEVALIRWLQGFGQPVPAFADVVRTTTGTEGNLVVGLLPAIWVVRRHGRDGLAAVAICLAAMLVVQPVGKELVDRDRPGATGGAVEIEVRADHSSRSYPSGHSLSTATVWGSAALYAARCGRSRAAAVLAIPIASTAVASGIDGVHWASDALAGTVVGGAAAWAAVGRVRPTRPLA